MYPLQFDDPLYDCFVTPILCKDLAEFGMAKTTIYEWRIRNKVAMLVTRVFDQDNYYKDAIELIDQINPPDHVIPAYTIKDVEKGLPEYLLTHSESDGYEIGLAKIYDMDSQKAFRMPDAIALLLIEANRKGVVKINKIQFSK